MYLVINLYKKYADVVITNTYHLVVVTSDIHYLLKRCLFSIISLSYLNYSLILNTSAKWWLAIFRNILSMSS